MSRILNTSPHESSNLLLNPHSKHKQTSQLVVDLALKNASITSIKIPLVRNLTVDVENNQHQQQQQQQPHMATKSQQSPSHHQNSHQSYSHGFESDLTELSWLTNNVQMFHTPPMVDFSELGN